MARNKWNTSAIFYSPFGHVVALAGSIISAASVIWDVEQDSDNSFSPSQSEKKQFFLIRRLRAYTEKTSQKVVVWFGLRKREIHYVYCTSFSSFFILSDFAFYHLERNDDEEKMWIKLSCLPLSLSLFSSFSPTIFPFFAHFVFEEKTQITSEDRWGRSHAEAELRNAMHVEREMKLFAFRMRASFLLYYAHTFW